jgi:hypothetical protein
MHAMNVWYYCPKFQNTLPAAALVEAPSKLAHSQEQSNNLILLSPHLLS